MLTPSSLSFIVKKAKVDTTTIAALDESPEPAGTVDEISMSKPCGSDPPVRGKNWFKTPCVVGEQTHVSELVCDNMERPT